ncbi:DUF6509 family protein [Peribacillus sp. SCS-37]|uniref:DUF6509 family protein n=1 Tax=Paraperibacillus esterisolvens TaxID=3115296 RepID=UPI003905C408
MLTIVNHEAGEIKDPFGILSGRRFEFFIQAEVPEDDELYTEQGIYIRAVFLLDEGKSSLVSYTIHEYETEKVLDFELDEEEEKMLADYCREHTPE